MRDVQQGLEPTWRVIRSRPILSGVVVVVLLILVVLFVSEFRSDSASTTIPASSVARMFATGKQNALDANAYNFGNTAGGVHYSSIGGGSPHTVSGVTGSAFIFSAIGDADKLAVDNAGNLGVERAVIPGGQGVAASGLYSGTGVPKIVAPNASLYLRFDGGNGARLYVNTSGPSKTGAKWKALPAL